MHTTYFKSRVLMEVARSDYGYERWRECIRNLYRKYRIQMAFEYFERKHDQ